MISSRRDAFDDQLAACTDRVSVRQRASSAATACSRTDKFRTEIILDSSTRRSADLARVGTTGAAARASTSRDYGSRTIGGRARATTAATAAGSDPAPH
jgi:hypothetical protein